MVGVDRIEVLLELGELPCPVERVGVDDVGRVALGVAVLASVCVEHELGKRSVLRIQDVEARGVRRQGGGLRIQDVKLENAGSEHEMAQSRVPCV